MRAESNLNGNYFVRGSLVAIVFPFFSFINSSIGIRIVPSSLLS